MTNEEAINVLEDYDINFERHTAEAIAEAHEMAIKALEEQPKEEEQAFHVMKGKWITQWNAAHQKEYYYCSECREEFSYDGETGIKMNDYKYCPHCGAKMEAKE